MTDNKPTKNTTSSTSSKDTAAVSPSIDLLLDKEKKTNAAEQNKILSYLKRISTKIDDLSKTIDGDVTALAIIDDKLTKLEQKMDEREAAKIQNVNVECGANK
jgi:hypothetical protein